MRTHDTDDRDLYEKPKEGATQYPSTDGSSDDSPTVSPNPPVPFLLPEDDSYDKEIGYVDAASGILTDIDISDIDLDSDQLLNLDLNSDSEPELQLDNNLVDIHPPNEPK